MSGVTTISQSCWCMETKFQPCRAAFRLRQCLSQGYVYNQCCWKHKFKFQKSHKKGAFPKENTLLKLLYLKITKLYKKWNGSKLQNWAMVRNQLSTNEKISARIEKYEHLIWGVNAVVFRYASYHGINIIFFDFQKTYTPFLTKPKLLYIIFLS